MSGARTTCMPSRAGAPAVAHPGWGSWSAGRTPTSPASSPAATSWRRWRRSPAPGSSAWTSGPGRGSGLTRSPSPWPSSRSTRSMAGSPSRSTSRWGCDLPGAPVPRHRRQPDHDGDSRRGRRGGARAPRGPRRAPVLPVLATRAPGEPLRRRPRRARRRRGPLALHGGGLGAGLKHRPARGARRPALPAADAVLTVSYWPRETPPLPLTDLTVGSVTRTLLETLARELADAEAQLQTVYDSAFLDTAEGRSLDRVVALLGIDRRPPDTPQGKVRFHRRSGSAGLRTIPPVDAGALDRLAHAIAGIDRVVNEAPTHRPAEGERDEQLRAGAPSPA